MGNRVAHSLHKIEAPFYHFAGIVERLFLSWQKAFAWAVFSETRYDFGGKGPQGGAANNTIDWGTIPSAGRLDYSKIVP